MSLSNPVNPPIVNEAVAQPVSTGRVIGVDENQTKVNQLHGIAVNNVKGAGIPKQVTNAQVSIANAQQGSTCTASILFKQDPTDTAFSGVDVWVKGYNGNSNPVKVGSGISSPTQIVLNNTGETVTFILQAFGNGGSAPFSQAPTCSGTLPKSTSGGFGSSSVVSAVTLLTMPAEFTVAQSGSNITVGKATESANTVWAGPISGASAQPSFRKLNVLDDATELATFGYYEQTQSSNVYTQQAIGLSGINTGTSGGTGSTATDKLITTSEYGLRSINAGTTGVVTPSWMASVNLNSTSLFGVPVSKFRRYMTRGSLSVITYIRVWIGMTAPNVINTPSIYASDTPNAMIVGFRYSRTSSGGNWFAVTQTDNTHQTATDTGVAADTNVHDFRIDYDGSNFYFYIDNVLKVTQSSNAPTNPLGMFATVDNQNNAAQASWQWAYMQYKSV